MRVSSWLLISPAVTIALTAVVVTAIAVILLASNFTITNAQQQQQQQQQQPLTSQPSAIENRTATTTTFQSANDSFRVQVPEGWVIHDVNNTGPMLLEESTKGYGILAQLCPQEEGQQQQGAALSNVSGSGDTASCQGSEGDIIHIVRYPDLDTRLQAANNTITTNSNNMTTDNILSYHLQKLQEVGYSGIEIVDSLDTTLNVTNAHTNQTIAIIPAKNVEITYSTSFAPNETRTGYFISTATNATPPNLGTTKGYTIFYEGNSTSTSTSVAPETTTATASNNSLPLPPTPVRQVFDSFELIAAPEVSQPIAQEPAPEAPAPLTVEITSSDTEGVAPATFEFDADVTGGTEPYTYSWDFDDGESSEEIDDDETEHTFEEAGTYNVGLTVTDSDGQNGSDDMEITVEEPPAEEEENNNSGSNDLFGVDDLFRLESR